MKSNNILIKGNNISLRLIRKVDIQQYYQSGFIEPDDEIQKCTGTKHIATKEDIIAYVNRITEDESRYDFLIIDSEGNIAGESVINEIDTEIGSANFRICLFKAKNCGQGIGAEAIQLTIKFGFEKLNLHRIELEVFSFNKRAYKAYLRAGFREEGRKREAEFIGGQYCDVIIMSILREEYNLRNLEEEKLNEPLEEVVGELLVSRELTISTAESCTGGLIAGTLINYPGISSVLSHGVVTYSNEAKVQLLGVKEETLKAYGAVSEQIAREMVEGLIKLTKTRIGISVTGIAGPGGGTVKKPVGLVYAGLYIDGKIFIRKFNFEGNRQEIRNRTVVSVLEWLRGEIQ